MDDTTWGYGEKLLAALTTSLVLLRDLPVQVSRLGGADLVAVVGTVDELAAVAAAGRFTLASEADQRGEVAGSASGSVRQWVTDHCPSLEAREVGTLTKAVTRLNTPELEQTRAAVAAGRLSIAAGVVAHDELTQLRPLLEPGAESAVLAGLVDIGTTHGCAGVRSLRPALLERYGLGLAIQDEQDRRAGLTRLSCGHDIGGGVTEYRMRLTPESRAVVEAAINTLAAPRTTPSTDTGLEDRTAVLDLRTVEQRRGDALVEVCRRVAALGSAGGSPVGAKATVIVTMGYDELVDRTRPGRLLGQTTSGTVLGPETVRRLACDAAVVPVLLGSEGQVLDLGRTTRAFSPAQVKALWLRDRHCTYPGCDVPATWCDAHHVRHWADGGATALANGALLCSRHHHVVHRDRITADVGSSGVVWDRVPGSYERGHPPGPPTHHPPRQHPPRQHPPRHQPGDDCRPGSAA